MKELYFAYGSNLNSADLRSWCLAENAAYPLEEKFANAFIPDMRLTFNFFSEERGGGVLNIRKQLGNAVPGALFRVAPGGWEVLHRRELAPKTHRAIKVTALTEDGRAHEAVTYLVSSEFTEGVFVPPAAKYARVVGLGLEENNIDSGIFSATASGKEPPWCIDHLFVYGTFMRNERRHHILRSWGISEFAETVTAPGALYDSGKGYPAMCPAEGQRVTGELFRLQDPRASFEILDIVDEFKGYEAEGSNFRRAVVRTSTPSGQSVLAWVYLLNGTPGNMRLIESGNWREAEKGA